MPFDGSSLRQVPAELAADYRAQGHWTDDGLGAFVAAGLQAGADFPFRVYSGTRPWTGTVRQVDVAARRLATSLRARGVGPGDVVVVQLPNWVEAGITFWACAYLGAVVVPVVHFYGAKELAYILEVTDPKVVVTPDEFGRSDYLAVHGPLLADRRASWLVVRATERALPPGATDLATLLDTDPLAAPLPVDPDGPALIAFTSGTTRNPKGVVHSHRTIAFESRQLEPISYYGGGVLTGTPVGHMMGMLQGFLMPMVRAKSINLVDVWDAGRVLEIMRTEELGFGGGATYFLTSLLDHPTFTDEHVPFIPSMGLGGSAVPVAVTERAESLGIKIFRAYGSTEHPSVTASWLTEPADRRLHTDGHPLAGVELRLDADRQILTRGPDLFLGYTDPELTAQAVDAEGWYHTGDVGVIDDRGYVTIVDRIADVIIRAGENISAVELEDLLLTMTGVAEVSVVGEPDARVGEHAAAVFRLHPGREAPTLAQVRAHLDGLGLARQKWPESIFVVPEFPRTATGKVQKFRVREQVRTGSLTPVER